jgi:hypothetical protein
MPGASPQERCATGSKRCKREILSGSKGLLAIHNNKIVTLSRAFSALHLDWLALGRCPRQLLFAPLALG